MSFITGAVGQGRSLAVLAQLEDGDGPIDLWHVGFWRNGEWRTELELDFKPVAVCAIDAAPDVWAVLGIEGEVRWIANATSAPEIRDDRVAEGPQPAFTSMRSFQRTLVAGQMGRRVYRFDSGVWRALEQGMALRRPGESVGIEAMAAVDDELYACGWAGEIWRLEANVWHRVDSPTNVILTGADSDAIGRVTVCGRLGTILHGRHDQWDLVRHSQTDEDFWSVAAFKGSMYVSSMRAIYRLLDGRLEPVNDDSLAGSYYHLSANDEIMVSIGARAVLVTDGVRWQQIIG